MDATRFLPLKPKVFMVLLAIREGAAHGYAIRKDVLERSDGAVELDPGGLYRLIARLEADGLIVALPPRPDDDDRRNTYGLTELGGAVLAEEARRLARLVDLPEVREITGGAGA